ncbi:hypothetical protein O5O45_13415 [Hahella aquimaris]|uniref:DUF6160 family protein n=1 Tax=Hahella sp. HNIBRBA332 TaxID=3015983 RepID=UPI00273B7A01|nr:DUF6160 family protein [Hahella sp. HNIBRBA332]WLQ16913.1 hypothetical protein O5O45_13415 [Hahella sp. HNIBRBA332]
MKKTVFVCAAMFSTAVMAELKPINDQQLSEVVGQAAPVIEINGQVTYEAIAYTNPDGVREVIYPGQTSSDGAVHDDNVSLQGMTFGTPRTGTLVDLFTAVLPLRYGEIDTNGDGVEDRGAAIFSFQPNVGFGTGFMPLDIQQSDTSVNIDDQVFLTKQGLVILNAPINTDIINVGADAYKLTPIKMF